MDQHRDDRAGQHEEVAPVVVAYDGSAQAAAALRWGAQEAAMSAARLDVVVAWQPRVDAVAASWPDMEHDRAEELGRRAAGMAAQVGGRALEVRAVVDQGTPRSVILRRAKGAGLVVMGTAGHVGRLGALLGSVSRYVVERIDVPVVLLGPEAAGFVESRIVVVAAFGVADPHAVTWAVERALGRSRSVLHLLDTWSPPGLGLGVVEGSTRELARRQAVLAHEQALWQLRQLAGDVPVSGALFEGRPSDVEYAHGLPGDLLVVAADDVGRRPSLAHVRCPVAVVPAVVMANAMRSPLDQLANGIKDAQRST